MKKYYHFDTMFSNLRDGLRNFLKANNIYYELSGCGQGWHFEVLCSNADVVKVNDWLDQNTITEVR